MGASLNRRRQLAVMSAEAVTPDDGQAARAATVAGSVMQRTQLKTTPLGTTDLEITRVGFGSWAIGGGGWEFGWGPQADE